MMDFVLKRPRRSPLVALQSAFIHAAIVSGALWATRAVADVIADPGPRTVTLTYTAPSTVPVGPVGSGIRLQPPVIGPIPDLFPPIDPILVGPAPVDPRPLATGLPAGLGSDTLVTGVPSAISIYQESDVDDLPVLVSAPAPRYPRVMAEAGIDGSVTLSFVIDVDGKVVAGSAKVIRASHDAFVPAAEEAVYASLFRPARRRGESVPVLVRQTVVFRH